MSPAGFDPGGHNSKLNQFRGSPRGDSFAKKMDARVKPAHDGLTTALEDLTTALEEAERLAALAGLEARLVPPVRNIDHMHRAVALAGHEQFVAVERHVHRLLPTLIAVCSRNDGSIRLTVSLLRLVTPIRLLSGA